MRKFLLFIIIIYAIVFILIKSNVIETRQWKENIAGAEYLRNSYNFNLDNLIEFLKNLPSETISALKSLFK